MSLAAEAMEAERSRARSMNLRTTKGVTIKIRDFRAEDLKSVVEIDRASLLGGSAEIYAELAGLKTAVSGTGEVGAFAEVFLVAERNADVVGFIVAVPFSAVASRIFALAVHPKHRGMGIGKALLRAALNELRRLRKSFVRLEVRESNFIAQNLYKSMNFTEIGYIPFYYWDGEGAIVMQKVL
ncbi:MAG: GNAT family N-acetyltransferase [Candidatus Methanospirare jalkutatii]|nr:GNAT family N-acetyltransferase [Candidatus Methanospirare jalkutatii]